MHILNIENVIRNDGKNYYKRVGFTQKVIKISKKEKRFSIIRY